MAHCSVVHASRSVHRGACASPCSPFRAAHESRAAVAASCLKLYGSGGSRSVHCKAAQEENKSIDLVGEDAASFSVEEQTVEQWTRFFVVLGVVAGTEVRSSHDQIRSSLIYFPLAFISR